MPVIIEQKQVSANTYSPKFFNQILTGNGKKQGLLRVELDYQDDRYGHGRKHLLIDQNDIKIKSQKISSGTTIIHQIPLTNISTESNTTKMYFAQLILSYESAKETFVVLKQKDYTYYAIPVNVTVSEPYDKKKPKEVTVTYLHAKVDQNGVMSQDIHMTKSPYYYLFVNNVTDPNEQENYSVYQAIAKMSELMQVHFNDITTNYINVCLKYKNLKHPYTSLNNLTDFDLTFEHYSELYESIKQWFANSNNQMFISQLKTLIIADVNLLMLDSVHALINQKHQHHHTTTPGSDPKLADFLSPDQTEAATTNEPFVLVQAGAGTGKSTTIIERIKYMEAAGVDLHNIRVISLTNAAADNITEKNNQVQSTTIAKYIADIYKINYPHQEIVDFQTLKNTIMIYAGHIPCALDFRKLITDKDSMQLLTFIRDNFDEVVEILNLTHQTTLQIQSYISYLKAETFNYGDDTATHFIVDETQDNNVFEFIYLMKIAALRKASLYIVGDASQTLYEFRGASSQALNAIETSGVFECIKLDINYRSNQYILDFANTTLADIDVNRFAQIQLQSGTFEKQTKQQFKETVQIKPIGVPTQKEFDEHYENHLSYVLPQYIQDKLNNNEKVTLLARKGLDVQKLENWATKNFSNYIVTNLVPKRSYSSTLFSSYIRQFWNEITLTPKSDVIDMIAKDIDSKLYNIYKGRADSMRNACRNQINNWVLEEGKNIKFLHNQFKKNLISNSEMMNKIRDNMIQYEVRKNVIRQSLLKQEQDQLDKEELIKKSNILISTVHSVKGLEFDNVVYLHKNSESSRSKSNLEEEKRIDYVALTRAKKTELILDVYLDKSYSKLNYNYQALLENYQ